MGEEKLLKFLETKDYSEKDLAKFKNALSFAKEVLENKKRLTGDTYFEYNLRVAKTLVENKASPELIEAALLLRTIRHCSEEKVKEQFGEEIVSLLKGVNEITKIKAKNEKLTANNLRKVLLVTVNDVRIILLKLADKLENERDIKALPKDDQVRISKEILDIYAPLAYRLGVEKIRTELEDLAFKVLNPRRYKEIVDFLQESKEARESEIKKVIDNIKAIKSVPVIKVKGRTKHIYSIYKKIVSRGKKLSEQYDLLGIRAIVPEIKDCYALLGALHEKFQPVGGRLKDYIATPKPNGYQSIHTTLRMGPKKYLEVQIRTEEMDEFAEEGLAAHWQYKGLKSDRDFERRLVWMKDILDLQKDANAREFLENIKLNVFAEQIYCYTPKGDVKYLPEGASVLDFAYSIHDEVGNHSIGARVNGHFVPLRTKLNKGDVVEIVTSKNQRPRRNWIKFVKSSKAKQKIRKAVKLYQDLPALHYRTFKSVQTEDFDSLVFSPQYPKAACVLAKCCQAVPKEKIVGIATKRRMISVHRRDCERAVREEERWVKVEWKETFSKNIKFYVNATERSGLLADLLHTIVSARFEVKEAQAKFLGNDFSQCSFLIVPQELDAIEMLVNRLKKVKGVKKVFFD
jgi:GTP diphosphokinase / guanosine-3',5'-bis(diphosphate) 3'-diphosphatase